MTASTHALITALYKNEATQKIEIDKFGSGQFQTPHQNTHEMRKNTLALLALIGTIFTSNAQFSAVYDNDLLSLNGYDIVKLNGKYFFSSGDGDNKVLFEIDPTDGSIITPSFYMKQFTTTGSRNNIGKNSTSIGHFFPTPQTASWHTGMLMTGLQDYNVVGGAFPTYPGLNYYHVEESGGLLSEYGAEEFIPPADPTANLVAGPAVGYVTAYADQMTMDIDASGIEDYIYLTGSAFGAGTNWPLVRTPFVVRHHKTFSSVLPQSNYMRILSDTWDPSYHHGRSIPEYTTRIIRGENTLEAFITSGPGLHDGNGAYKYSATKRDAGVWALGSNFWTQFCKTYSNGSLEDNLGVAQSIVMSDLDENLTNYPLTFIAGGDHPNTATNPHGTWDKNYFHLVKIRSTNGTVLNAKKYTMTDPHPEYMVAYTHVNGTDLVYVPNLSIAQTSNKTSTGIYAVAGTATKHYVGASSISLERVFVVIMNKNLGVQFSADFNATDINPADVRALRVNRIKYMDEDFWIVGSFESQHNPGHRIPFLLRVEVNLESGCNDFNTTWGEEATIAVLDRPNTQANHIIERSPEDLPDATSLQVDDNEFCRETDPQDDPAFDSPAPFQETVDIHKTDMESAGITLLPNPTRGQVTVTFPIGKTTTLSIIDVTGKTVAEYHNAVSGKHQFDVSALIEGVYLLRVTQGAETHTMKLVKE